MGTSCSFESGEQLCHRVLVDPRVEIPIRWRVSHNPYREFGYKVYESRWLYRGEERRPTIDGGKRDMRAHAYQFIKGGGAKGIAHQPLGQHF